MRILLAGAVVFLAVWFTLLRPKSEPTPVTAVTTPPAGNVNTGEPAVSGPGKVVEKAKTTAATAESATKAAAGEATTPTTDAKTGAATTSAKDPKSVSPVDAIPAAALAKLPEDVAGALSSRRVLVLAVLTTDGKAWRPLADDDRYVRNTLKHVNRYDGNVLVKQVPLSKLAGYSALVNDLHVNQTPSVVVVDRNLKANVLTGYVDRIAINQAIADARAGSIDVRIKDAYLRKANQVCANGNVSFSRWSEPTIPGKKARVASAKRFQAALRNYRHAIRRLAAPKRWRGLKRQWLSELAGEQRMIDRFVVKAKRSDVFAAMTVLATWDDSAARKLDHRFDAVGLTSCSQLRRM
jgi:hypothetical protein